MNKKSSEILLNKEIESLRYEFSEINKLINILSKLILKYFYSMLIFEKDFTKLSTAINCVKNSSR